jgi:membrane protein implicated in regulation of membrane protease activity
MKRPAFARATFVRYLLLQLPGLLALLAGLLVARRFVELSGELIVVLAAGWLAKDLALYPLLRPAYEVDSRSEMEKLTGEEAVVTTSLEPAGQVRLRGALWLAEAAPGEPLPVARGSGVRIEGHRGLVLLVGTARRSDDVDRPRSA